MEMEVKMDYERHKLPIRLRAYGRTVQELVARIRQEPDRDTRNRLAQAAVRAMKIVGEGDKSRADYDQQVWEDLLQLGEYQLDIDTPFEITPRERVIRPGYVPYYKGESKIRQYGQNIERMVSKARQMPAGEARDAYVQKIATTMKIFQQLYGGGFGADALVLRHLEMLSEGALNVNPNEVNLHVGKLNTSISNASAAVEPRRKRNLQNNANKRKNRRGRDGQSAIGNSGGGGRQQGFSGGQTNTGGSGGGSGSSAGSNNAGSNNRRSRGRGRRR
jgi:hypothetical protein